ncbi:MAG: hypothetical protein K2V38_20090, partial [Gemmataceae bacterium]|nr:hypothetical protein [Gemmataceae bacterium]
MQQVSFDPKRPRLAVCVGADSHLTESTQTGPRVVWFDTRTWEIKRSIVATECARGCTWAENNGVEFDVTDPLAHFPDGPTAFALSPDHRRLVLAWPGMMIWDKWQQMTEWNVEAGWGRGPWQGLRERFVERLSFSPNGQHLVGWARTNAFRDDRGIVLLDELKNVYFREHITAVAFTPDESAMVYATESGCIWGWEVSKGQSGYLELPPKGVKPTATAPERLCVLSF